MRAGDVVTPGQQYELDRVARNAERICGLHFSIFVGRDAGPSRAVAESLHSRLDDPLHSVLVYIDLSARQLEIVTGGEARRWISDADCGLAMVSIQAGLLADDLIGGLRSGVQQLADRARQPPMLHAEEV